MRNLNLSILLILAAVSISSLAPQPSLGAVAVIANPIQKGKWTQDEINSLYSAKIQPRRLELLDQAEGQAARKEFYEKFVTDNPNKIKQRRCILVFSGERAPAVLSNDQEVFDYVITHPNAIGYVSGDFWDKKKSGAAESVELFTFK